MATNNRKDNHFLVFYTYLLLFLKLAWVTYLETRQSCENDFGRYFNFEKKMKNLSTGFLKIVHFHIFDLKERNPLIIFYQKIIL